MPGTETKKIILTGGHAATTALAVVKEIQKKRPEYDLIWIGPRSAIEGQLVETAAERVLRRAGVRVVTIDAGRLKKRGSPFLKILALGKIPYGFFQAFYYVLKFKPQAVVSFGGFAAFPVVFCAWFLRIPSIVHEQVVGLGLANRLSVPFAKKVTVAREVSLNGLPQKKAVLVGNPQIAEMFEIKRKEKIGDPPVIYVTGGSSGSQIVNQVILEILPELLKDYRVFHQVGENNLTTAQQVRENLSENLKKRYQVFGYVDPYEQAKIIALADIIIARSGANTVADIVNSVRPAILIPIPWTIGDEQAKNAQAACKLGIAVLLEQKDLTKEALLQKISQVRDNWTEMAKNTKKGEFARDSQAATELFSVLETELA